IESTYADSELTVPFAYSLARTETLTEKDQSIVVAGTDFDLVRKLNPWWLVSSWPKASGEALIGVRASRMLAPSGSPFVLQSNGHAIRLTPAGIVRTGAGEDSRVYVSLQDFYSWTGLDPSVVEV